MKIYIDGEYFDKDNACISVFDHGLLYGDGVFEGIRIYSGRAFKLKEHIKRLFMSAKAIRLDIPLTEKVMEETVTESIRINGTENGYIRLVVTRGKGDLGVDPAKCPKASVIIIVADIELYPEEYYTKGIKIITASTRRLHPDGIDPRIKSLNYLNNILAKIEAAQAGCMEAVMLNKEGYVTECTGDNIFIIYNNVLLTPAPACGILNGITRQTVIELAESTGVETASTFLTQYDLYTADECFLTGTGAEIIPVIMIDGRVVGNGEPGRVTGKLMNEFRATYMPRNFS
ncbi:MAG: branched-chain-amino-acid transaminase [Spirochaetales bacterium]|nr:branched-chain-amino-acid transaminase [Spirochaetales bacterium]